MDRWHGLSLQDIREIEEKTREELHRVSFRKVINLYNEKILLIN